MINKKTDKLISGQMVSRPCVCPVGTHGFVASLSLSCLRPVWAELTVGSRLWPTHLQTIPHLRLGILLLHYLNGGSERFVAGCLHASRQRRCNLVLVLISSPVYSLDPSWFLLPGFPSVWQRGRSAVCGSMIQCPSALPPVDL